MKVILVMLLGYLMGAIPFGLLVARLCRGVDIRQLGSGNIGATNVLRVMGWKGGLLVLVLDAAKGFLPVVLAIKVLLLSPLVAVFVGLAAILGHTFSPFLRFTGGRGVATGLGVFLALSWKAAGCGFMLAAGLMAAFRYVSLGSIFGSLSLPLFMLLFHQPAEYIVFSALIAILIVLRHISNIRRLLAGTESKIGQKVQKSSMPMEIESEIN